MATSVGAIFADVGARYSDDGFKRFDKAVSKAKTDAQKKIEAQLGAELDTGAFNQYEQHLRRAQDRASRRTAFKAQLGADFDSRAFNQYERALAKAERETRSLDSSVGGLSSSTRGLNAAFGDLRLGLGPVSGRMSQLGRTAALLSPAIGGVAGALTALASSAASAAAGVAAVGTGLGAALTPLGAVAGAVAQRVGVIQEAYKALSTEQVKGAGQATATAETQRAAALRVQEAQRNLAEAQRDVVGAQEDLTDARFRARRELQDLAAAADSTRLAEERANISLEETVQRLAEVEADPESTRLELKSAELAVREARAALADTRRERKRADEDAKRGTDTVREAQENLAQARRGAAEASDRAAEASRKSSVASEKQGAAATDAQQKLAQLTDAERRLVTTLDRSSKAVRRAFQPATDAIFTSTAGALDRLTPVLEGFRDRFTRLGDALADEITRGSSALTSPEWVNAFEQFGQTAQRIVRPLGDAAGSVAVIARNVAIAAQPFVVSLIRDLAQYLGKVADSTSDTGRLRGQIGQLVESFRAWTGLMRASVGLLATVFGGGREEGDQLVVSLTRMVERWDAFLETDEGQRRMRNTFRSLVNIARDMVDILRGFLGGLRSIFAVAGDLVRPFVRLAESVGLLGSSRNDMEALGRALALMAVLRFTGITALIRTVTGAALARSVASGGALATMPRLLTAIRAGFVAVGVALAANPLGAAVIALGALSAALVVAYRRSDRFKEVVHDAFQFVRRSVGRAIDTMLGYVSGLLDGFSAMVGAAAKIPGVGRVFRGLSNSLDNASDSVDKLRRNIRESTDPMAEFSKGAELMRRRSYNSISDLRKDVARQMVLIKRSTRDGSKDAREALRDNFDNAVAAVRRAMRRGTVSTRQGMDEIKRLMSASLRAVGYSAADARRLSSAGFGASDFENMQPLGSRPPRPGRAMGGWLGGRGMVGTDTVPIMAAPGEAVINRHQVPVVEAALSAVGIGGLDELFSRIQRPHYLARGGYIQGAQPPRNRPIRALANELFGRGYNVTSGGEYRGTGTNHDKQNALDFGDSANDLPSLWRVLFPRRKQFVELFGPSAFAGLFRFGNRFQDAGLQADHEDHIHVALVRALRGALGAGGSAMGSPEKIRRVRVRRDLGLVSAIAQGAVDKVRAGANARLAAMGDAGGDGAGSNLPGGTSGANQSIGRRLMRRFFPANQWPALRELWTRESGWDNRIRNPTSGAFGIPQALPPTKMPPAAQRGHAGSQIMWGLRYIKERYGSPSRALAFHNANNWYSRGGRIQSFKRGGRVKADPLGAATNRTIRSLRPMQSDRIGDFDSLLKDVEGLQRGYSQQERRFNLTDEELIDETTGQVDENAVKARAKELLALLAIRARIRDRLEKAQRLVRRIVASYTTIINRLTRAKRAASKQKRPGYQKRIDAYTERLGEWQEKDSELAFDVEDARIDVEEIRAERKAVLGTTADTRDEATGDAGDAGAEPEERSLLSASEQQAADRLERDQALAGLTPGTADDEAARGALESFWRGILENLQNTGAPDTLVTQAANTLRGFLADATQPVTDIATQVAEALAAFQQGRSDLFRSFGSNYTTRFALFNDDSQRAAGLRNFGAFGASDASGRGNGAGGSQVNITNNYGAPPPDPHIWSQQQRYQVEAAMG